MNYNMTINHPQFRGRAESRDLLFRCVNFFVQQEIKKIISFSTIRAKEQSPKLKDHVLGCSVPQSM